MKNNSYYNLLNILNKAEIKECYLFKGERKHGLDKLYKNKYSRRRNKK